MLNLPDDLEPQFAPRQERRGAGVLLYDGDIAVYKAAATVKTLDTAVRRFYTIILTDMFLTQAKSCIIYLTPHTCVKCYRSMYPSVKEYQAQRGAGDVLPLKEPLRRHLIANPHEYKDHGITIKWSNIFEADDLMIQDAYIHGSDCIISSADKDLRMTPFPYWEPEFGKADVLDEGDYFGYIKLDDTKANRKVVGHGLKFFFAQLLMGDGADNVKGIKNLYGTLCGPMLTYKYLKNAKTEREAAQRCIRAYKAIRQNMLAEAELMFLRRTPEDSAYQYFMEVAPERYHGILTAWHNENKEKLNHDGKIRLV